MARARMFRTLFIPDLNGQYKLWDNEIKELLQQVDEVVCLGNLIGCNPVAKDSESRGANQTVLNRVMTWRYTFPNWHQIVGPNEIMSLNYPDHWTNKRSNRMLRRLWFDDDPSFKVAAVNRERLVTHGGLTYGLWRELGSPTDPHETANMLNEKYHKKLYFGKAYKLGNTPNFSADPVFADPLRETYPSWITSGVGLPFDQVHAGSSLNTEVGDKMKSLDFNYLVYLKTISHRRYGGNVELENGGFFKSIYLDLDYNERIKYVPRGMGLLIETTPALDLRDELFLPKKEQDALNKDKMKREERLRKEKLLKDKKKR